ncbi:GatB/YqeY domain-containing protein [Halovulum sp. GXIMD14793]
MIRKRLNENMKEAMKARDQDRLSTIRLINAAIKDREIALRGDGDETVGEDEILAILAKMIKQREESAATYDEAGRIELAERERAEVTVIREFMPKQLSAEEVSDAIKSIIAETGANSIRDMGRIMGVLKEKYAGRMDFGKVGAEVKALLG